MSLKSLSSTGIIKRKSNFLKIVGGKQMSEKVNTPKQLIEEKGIDSKKFMESITETAPDEGAILMPENKQEYDFSKPIVIDFSKYSKLPTPKKKVCIVGFAKSWVETPFEDPDFEIWGLNELYKYFKQKPCARADRWFEIHNPKSPSKDKPEHHEFLKTCGMPVYMWQHFDEFPTSMPFPREEVKAMMNENMIYGGHDLGCKQSNKGSKFTNFSNQITWMILLAIYEGFQEIHVYGVDMATKEEIKTADGKMEVTGEYVWQRPSCEAVTGYALGKGIKILIPQNSELCKFPMDYGFDTDNQTRCFIRGRKKELVKAENKLAYDEQQLMQQIEQIRQRRANIRGSISEISYQLGNHIV
jgi:hypothetical protein